jgi:DNA (cytosine-5)-methyltransferase 1
MAEPQTLYFLLTVPELDKPSPTLSATAAQVGAASLCHPTECRKLTPAEAKAISGFPADFILTGTAAQRVERMGRAVTPPLYAAVGSHLARYLA